jgi:hypothetical protein
MSADLKALITKNELNLPKDAVDKLLSMNGRNMLAPLSPDRESAPFLLYCCGDDLELIAAKMTLPRDVITATAIQYRWPEKAKLMRKDGNAAVPNDLQKDLVNSILVATFVAMQRELSEVVSGKRLAKDCALIPSSPAALEKLMNMITTLNTPVLPGKGGPVADPVHSGPQTVIHAGNVHMGQAPERAAESEEKKAVRLAMLKDLDESAG